MWLNVSFITCDSDRIDQSQQSMLDLSWLGCDWSKNTIDTDQWSSGGVGCKEHGLKKMAGNQA